MHFYTEYADSTIDLHLAKNEIFSNFCFKLELKVIRYNLHENAMG